MNILIAFGIIAGILVKAATDCSSPESPFKSNIFCDSYIRYDEPGGKLYEVTGENFPAISGYFSMAYETVAPYCLRQIHWHAQNEIAYVNSGSARVGVSGVGGESSNFNVSAGDFWYFPAGYAQFFQAGPDGINLTVWFNKDEIATVTSPQVLNQVPKDQIQESLSLDTTLFNDWTNANTVCPTTIPTWTIANSTCDSESKSDFKFTVTCSTAVSKDNFGNVLLKANADSFPILKDNGLAFAFFVVKPGCQRVLHWHTVPGELALVLSGSAEIGLFSFANRTDESEPSLFNVTTGDIWFFPPGFVQYITTVGDEDIVAAIGFSEDSINAVSTSTSLKLLPEDVVSLSLGAKNQDFWEKLSVSEDEFTCVNKD